MRIILLGIWRILIKRTFAGPENPAKVLFLKCFPKKSFYPQNKTIHKIEEKKQQTVKMGNPYSQLPDLSMYSLWRKKVIFTVYFCLRQRKCSARLYICLHSSTKDLQFRRSRPVRRKSRQVCFQLPCQRIPGQRARQCFGRCR